MKKITKQPALLWAGFLMPWPGSWPGLFSMHRHKTPYGAIWGTLAHPAVSPFESTLKAGIRPPVKPVLYLRKSPEILSHSEATKRFEKLNKNFLFLIGSEVRGEEPLQIPVAVIVVEVIVVQKIHDFGQVKVD